MRRNILKRPSPAGTHLGENVDPAGKRPGRGMARAALPVSTGFSSPTKSTDLGDEAGNCFTEGVARFRDQLGFRVI
jgi:hypothetical protein